MELDSLHEINLGLATLRNLTNKASGNLETMVKIIDGEIVQDDDPRAIEWEKQQRQNHGWSDPRLRAGFNQQQQHGAETQNRPDTGTGMFGLGGMMGGQGQPGNSTFQGINQKLSEMGLRPWNIGGYVVKPVFTIALVIAALFYGVRGMLIVAIIWYLFGR